MLPVVGFPSDLANSQTVDSHSGFGHTLRRSAAVSRLFPPPPSINPVLINQDGVGRLNRSPLHTKVWIGLLWQLALR